MRRKYWFLLGLCAQLSALCLATSSAQAQQLRPYFLVIVDTSGSMAWCAGGNTAANGTNDCSCHQGGNCAAAFNTNRCGFEANKLGDAKCALQRILDGVGGDATFGLMQFEHPCDNACNPTGAQCSGTLGVCGPECNDGQLAVEIASGNANLMREWVDGECQGSCGTNDSRHELTAGQWTPIARSLQRANEYLRGQVNGGDPMPYVTGQGMWSPPLNNDSQLSCRPVSVILLTDGDDTCSNVADAPNAAGALNSGNASAATAAAKAFRTYVIGFGESGGNFNPAVLNQIAERGGTDARPSAGGSNRYFEARNEESLSLALSRIIADSQPPVEVCNNADDDCDGNSDEGLPKFCNKPAGINDPTLCDEPDETNCDGMDDDCDGVLDEGLTNACGDCGDLRKEVCDSIDNDCDSRIDEDTDNMESCGKATGECMTGQLVCVAGMEQCEGEVGPMAERCDCKDNDCDGTSDEENPDRLCAEGERCAGCNCVKFCDATVEFAASCPDGLRADIQPNGECLCIVDNCDLKSCRAETHEEDGQVICAPNNKRVAACLCRAGSCVDLCNGVTCKSGETCNPKSGGCVEDSCRGLGCADGLLCDPGAGRCVQDACANAKCASDQVCRAGQCESSCAGVTCSADEACRAGVCERNPCARKSCEQGEICDPESGECADDRCTGLTCKPGQECSQNTGKCEAEVCWNVNCPSAQVCIAGQCQFSTLKPTPGSIKEAAGRLLATGGGGCACSVPGPQNSTAPLHAIAVWLGLLGMVWLRRTRKQPARWRRVATLLGLSLALIGVVSLGGCKITPLCIDCVDSGTNSEPGSMSGSGTQEPDAGSGSREDAGNAGQDAGGNTGVGGASGSMSKPPPCVPADQELCNNKDDDCDFMADEDVVPTSNDCNQVGVCAGTNPICASGAFICRYSDKYEMTESLCDGLDNDCNGKVDESFPMLGGPCEAGVGACKTQGVLRCAGSGKSLSCDAVPDTGTDEVCNGLDDDCDGMADEPRDNPGTSPSYVRDDVVKLRDNLWIYAYEASRVDADATKPGIVTTRTCSRAGVLPWTNVTYTEAERACQSVGMQLCNLDDWVRGCRGGNDCAWGASSSCNSYNDGACNAHDQGTDTGEAETDALEPTGASSGCFMDFGAAGKVFDMSGNAKEWTVGARSPNENPLRGGSYNNNPEALRCDFDFNIAPADVRLPNVGFRCCSTVEP